MAVDPYNLVMGPDGAFYQAEDVAMRGALDPAEAERLARYRAAQAAQMEAQLAREAAARTPSAVRNVAAGAARGSRGGPVGAIVGGALGPAFADNPEDIAPTSALGAVAGYGATKAAPILAGKLPSVSLPSLGTVGRFAGNAALLAPGVVSAVEQPSTEEMGRRLGFSEDMVREHPLITSGIGAINEVGFGIPGYINRQINRWQMGAPVEAVPRPALEPKKAPAPAAGEPVGTYFMRGDEAQAAPAAPAAPAAVTKAPKTALEPAAPQQVHPVIQEAALVSQDPSRFDSLMQRAQDEIGRVDQAFAEYQRQSGMVAPKELSAMDKWSALAKGLGVGLLMTAFPGFGVLAALGMGGLGGALALEGKQRENKQDALAERQRLGDMFKTQSEMSKNRMGALSDLMKAEQGQQTFAEGQRQFNQNYALNAIKERRLANQASIEGAQLKQAANGEYVFMYPNGMTRRTGQMGPLVTQSGQRYSVPGAVTGRMEALSKAGADPATLYQTALQQVTAEGGGSQLLPGVAEALAQY